MESVDRLTLTVQETAKILGLSRGTAFEQARQGILPGLLPRVGRRQLVSKALLERYLNGAWPVTQ